MKYFLTLFFLLPALSYAKEVKTDFFSLDLPDNYHAETDKKRRLLAFGGNFAVLVD